MNAKIAKVTNKTGMFLAAVYALESDAFDLTAALSDWNYDHAQVTRWVESHGTPAKVVIRHFTFEEMDRM